MNIILVSIPLSESLFLSVSRLIPNDFLIKIAGNLRTIGGPPLPAPVRLAGHCLRAEAGNIRIDEKRHRFVPSVEFIEPRPRGRRVGVGSRPRLPRALREHRRPISTNKQKLFPV